LADVYHQSSKICSTKQPSIDIWLFVVYIETFESLRLVLGVTEFSVVSVSA
jgi:hypothetical protein